MKGIKMPTGKGQTRTTLKQEKAKKILALQEARAKRSDSDQIRLLNSKGLDATKERERLIKRIEEKNDTSR